MSALRPLTLGLRGRLLLSVVASITVVLAALVLAFNVVLDDRLNGDATGVLRARASAELTSLEVTGGRITLGETPDAGNPDVQVWVFAGRRALEQPRPSANNRAAAQLATRAPATSDVVATDTRLYALPVAQTDRRLGAVVAGISLAPFEETRRTALIASVLGAAAVLLAVALAAAWLIDRALRPVARMTRQAADWSEHDLDRRFALGPGRDDLTRLASTLDAMLERLAASIRHERRLSAEISHELRTPLANVLAEAQYGLRHGQHTEESRATLAHIVQSTRQLGRTLDTLMAAARAQLDARGTTSDARACAQDALAAISRDASSRLEVAVRAPAEAMRIAVEPELVARILAPLLENAARHARHSVSVTIEREEDMVRFCVEDDGPGVPTADREVIFEPGHRAGATSVATAPASHGAGLGLALCRRLARTAGGDVHAVPSEAGARFVLGLPAA